MEKSSDSTVRDNLLRVEERICAACAAAGRPRDSVRLMAVTKTVELSRILEAIQCGIDLIGENRVQEYLEKKPKLANVPSLERHLIGHLQTNKVNAIVGQVDMIQSVDSLRLAQLISRRSEALGLVTAILVEVNIGGEESKSGVAPAELESLLYQLADLPGISVRGLMTVPPVLQEESEKRKIFSKMHRLSVDIMDKSIDNIDMRILSMGMSGDYPEAILEGATLVRVGSAIFGQRIYP